MTIRGPWYSFGSTDCAFGYEGNVDLLDRFVTCHQTIYYPSNTERISLQLIAGILVAGNIIIIIINNNIIIITIIIITIIIIIIINRVNIWSSLLLHLPTDENGCHSGQDRATSIETVIRRIATTITVQIITLVVVPVLVVVVVLVVVLVIVVVEVVLLSVIILITMMMIMMFFCKKCK